MSDDQAVDPRHAPTTRDGFRKRKKRPKGWMKQAIKDGVIPEPGQPSRDIVPPPGAHVISVPLATLAGDGTTD